MKKLLTFILLLCLVGVAHAQADIFDVPCAQYQVPKSLALAIAQQESNLYPWAVNIEGRSFRPRSREEALALIRKAQAYRLSFDIGIMQVNSWWLRRFGLSAEQVLHPQNNVLVGVHILAQEIRRHGLNWKAIASYHTPLHKNPARGRAYALAVLRRMYGKG